MKLLGKTAIVTGGSRGIGKAIAIKLAEQGANIVVNYSNSPESANEVIRMIETIGRQGIAIKADVSNPSEVEELISVAEARFSSIDILINNAGITRDTLLMKMKEDDWDSVITTNLKGTFNCTKAVTKKMIRQRSGKIVSVASVIGIVGNAGQANYAASKAGIIGFTKSIAKELGSRNINVNAVAPGYIQTDMTDKLSAEVKEGLIADIPLKRLGAPEDVANIVVFLCTEEASYITGQVFNVDGGMVM